MDGQTGDLHKRVLCTPVSALELLSVFTLDNDFAGKRKITVEPGAPETAAVGHNIELVVATTLLLAARCNFQTRRVRVASNNFERAYRFCSAFETCQERADCRSISREKVSLASSETPLACLRQLQESLFSQLLLAVVDRMEVRWGRIQAVDDLLGVFATIVQHLV